MKLIITTAVSLFLLVGTLQAQHANLGVKAGLNTYTLKGDGMSNVDRKLGYHLGLIGHIHFSDQFALQPELVYSVQGAQYSVSGAELKLNLNYFNVPVLFQYMFDNGFRLQAGPQLGFLASAKSVFNNSESNVKDDFEKIDLGLSVGASYVNPATNFGVDVRYNAGLNNINKSSNADIYNRGWQVGLFYLFNHN